MATAIKNDYSSTWLGVAAQKVKPGRKIAWGSKKKSKKSYHVGIDPATFSLGTSQATENHYGTEQRSMIIIT